MFLSNIWPPSLLYTNQVLMFLHSTARSADILNPGNLAIIPQKVNMVRLFLVHKLSIVNRDPDEIKAMYIQYARQSSVSTFKKEVDEYCRHLWQREIKQGLMYSNYSGPGFSILYTISISIFFSPISISIFLSEKFNINLNLSFYFINLSKFFELF